MKKLQSFSSPGNGNRLIRGSMASPSFALAALILLAGCASAPAEPESMIDQQANFNDYKTFSWLAHADSDEPISIVETKIRAAIISEMERKGYAKAPAGTSGDLLIDYDAARNEKVESRPFRIGIGVGSYGSSGGGGISTSTSGVKNISEGSLVIHAIDSARNTEVWRSQVSRKLGKGAIDAEEVQSIVTEIFHDFPARTVAP